MDGDVVANFIAITDADADVAVQYLSAADFNIESAVQLFFAAGGAADAHVDENAGVRERMESHVDQLVNPEEAMFEEMMRPRRRANRPINIFNQDRDVDLSETLSPHELRLAKLFRPPYELIEDLTLEEAKEAALEEGKWVMVNVQDPQIFACQQINRDLWNHHGVQEIVKSNFIFLQVDCQSSDGEEIQVLYQFNECPHISIIDPRTGEEQKSWSKVPSCEQFLEIVIDFLGQPGHQIKPTLPSHEHTTSTHVSETAMLAEQLEHEDLAEDSVSRPTEPGTAMETGDPTDQEVEEPVTRSLNPVDALEAKDIPEPAPGPSVTRLQFRLADGNRIVRRFEKSTSIADLYSFVKFIVPELEGKSVSLAHGRQNLGEDLESTIESLKLENSMVLVEAQ